MFRILFILLLLLTFKISFAQVQLSQSATHWKLYRSTKSENLRYSMDTLINFRYAELSTDSMRYFFMELKALPENRPAMWMGAYIATCEINHIQRKIDISMYGGFLYDEQDKQYYALPPSIRDDWMAYLNRSFHSIEVK